MKYKEFVKWCNERACDGDWSATMAMASISVMNTVNDLYFWQREKRWKEINAEFQIEKIMQSKKCPHWINHIKENENG